MTRAWTGSGPPGGKGPAVIAKHADSTAGPAVFYSLRELRPGDEITVFGGEESLTFEVDGVEQYPKDAFPTQQGVPRHRQRDATTDHLGGTFDRSTGHYEDNIVVYPTAQ